jgi:hypothetical protein
VQLVGARALLLQRVPAHLAGRASAVFSGMTAGAVSIGMAAAAPLVALLGVRGALAAAGVASVLAAVAARALRLQHLRGVPFIEDAPVPVASPASAGAPLAI